MKQIKGFLFKFMKKIYKFYWEMQYDEYREIYDISEDFKFNGVHINMYGNGKIILGSNSYIGNYSTIQAKKGCEVRIGDNCSISHNVRIYTASSIANQDFSKSSLKKVKANTKIEDNVWIGANVFIKQGCKIGENSVVGANSVVTKDIPPNCIVAGAPARIVSVKSYE